MKRTVGVLLLLLAVFAIFVFSGPRIHAGADFYPAPADAGFFGGDSDYGGSSGGGWDDSFGDSDWGSGGFGSSGGLSCVGGPPVGLIIFVIIVVFVILKAKKGGQTGSPQVPAVPPVQSTAVADQIRQVDPFFTEAEMREKVSNLYSEMQRAWENQDWEPMRARMTDDLYNQMWRQLQELVGRNQINRVERVAIISVALVNFYQDEQNDNLAIRLTTRITDYIIDRATGTVVSGDPRREKFMTYEWTMIRSLGVKTPAPGIAGKTEISRNCPHCGAPIDLTQSARCSYCGSIVTAPEFDWVLSNIRGISQQTI
ncbi:MAG TPA: TIM44-like domain-containing protein [Bacillota bacterium]|mgnify:CR=1 FL=1|jgi:hypothetical protein|nr:TIM44-like domain-containing protein [Fastidiosipila sp.]HPX93491.1 TIM44-like domain-containing protein [Bacillota bacterium]HQB81262.1 TIM44-like domain-containing protein [Bacillota bacterium]